jgi:hypothetical protein
VRIYLDVSCLNRPFDDQRQVRIRLESEAILAVAIANPLSWLSELEDDAARVARLGDALEPKLGRD